MNIKILKMVTGEQLITHVTDMKDSDGNNIGFLLSYPYVLIVQPTSQPNEPLKFNINYIAWMSSSKSQSFFVSYSSIIAIGEPAEEIEQEYLNQFGDLLNQMNDVDNSETGT